MTNENPRGLPVVIPAHVSADGHEIWDWAAKLGQATHRAHEKNELRRRIAGIGTTCGCCAKWMKRGDCPREKGVMVGGPSSGTPKCQAFVEKSSSAELRAELSGQLAAIDAAMAAEGRE